jgi:hypothetical protein
MTVGPQFSDPTAPPFRYYAPPGAPLDSRRTTSLMATGSTCPWPHRTAYPCHLLKGHRGEEKPHFPLFHRCQLRASARHHSSPVSRTSSPPLVYSVRLENPLELTVVLHSVLQLGIHPVDSYTGSRCRLSVSSLSRAPRCRQVLAYCPRHSRVGREPSQGDLHL